MKRAFYGWWVIFAAVITFGLSTGLPYYTKDFFYDYYAREFGWTPAECAENFGEQRGARHAIHIVIAEDYE